MNKNASKVKVHEEIRHGDFEKSRYIEVDINDLDAVTEMLNTCSYLRLPDPDFGNGAVLVSRSYDEIVAQRAADAKRIAKELANEGSASIGFVEYEVVTE